MTPWLDREMYPFASHYWDAPDGKMHYIDEGNGHPILMLHGTPTWSFLYRHLISGLRDAYRVIAPDYLGSGLSDKPQGFGYRPEDHARNLRGLIEALDLKDFTLMVHDFGGPIGMAYAVDHPDNVRQLIVMNSWMWSLEQYRDKAIIGRVLGGPVGRFLYKRMNLEFSVIVPSVYADRSKLTPAILAHYKGPFEHPLATEIAWIYARELLGSTDWYNEMWSKREAIQDTPALLLWGMQDAAFGPVYLERWQTVFTQAETHTFSNSGHFVQEEAWKDALPVIRAFLTR